MPKSALILGFFVVLATGILGFAGTSYLENFKSMEQHGNNFSVSRKYKAVITIGEAAVPVLRIKDIKKKNFISIASEKWTDGYGNIIGGIADVTGYVWAQYGHRDILIYSAESVRGKPGLYAYDPGKNKIRALLEPKSVGREDYYEIVGLENGEITYKYCNKVQSDQYETRKIKFDFGEMDKTKHQGK